MPEEPIKVKPKKGKIFFLTLIILSGIAVFSLLFLAFEGDRVTSYTIEKFVLSRDLLEKEFTEEVTPDERRKVVSDLHHFFESVRSGMETKERVASIGGKLREIMEDHKITRKEVQELENLLNRN
jgi:hypothetical protein